MMAQPPTVTVNDYLKEVRVFPITSAEFSQAASSLGVSASLASLGEGQSLIAAVRNDSGQAVELRILFQIVQRATRQPGSRPHASSRRDGARRPARDQRRAGGLVTCRAIRTNPRPGCTASDALPGNYSHYLGR